MADDRWEVEDLGNGTFDVRRNGRAVEYDRDEQEVRRTLQSHDVQSYTLIEPDGYRITKRI